MKAYTRGHCTICGSKHHTQAMPNKTTDSTTEGLKIYTRSINHRKLRNQIYKYYRNLQQQFSAIAEMNDENAGFYQTLNHKYTLSQIISAKYSSWYRKNNQHDKGDDLN